MDKSLLKSIGRIVIPIYNGDEVWTYDALVCDNVGEVIIGGNPLLDQGINPVTYRNEIDILTMDGSIRKLPWRPNTHHMISKPSIGILRSLQSVTLYPGDFLDVLAPPEFQSVGDAEVLVRPRSNSNVYSVYMSSTKYSRDLFPQPEYTWMIQGSVRLLNKSSLPVIIPKHKHFADISLVSCGVDLFQIYRPLAMSSTSTFSFTKPLNPRPIHLLKNMQLPDPSLYPIKSSVLSSPSRP